MYKLVKDYNDQHNKIPTRSFYLVASEGYYKIDSEKSKMGTWCVSQKDRYKRGTLSQDRIEKLEQISNWKWGKYYTKWEDAFKKLKNFVNKNKRMPKISSKNEKESKIALWFDGQKKKYNDLRLQKWKIEKFESLYNFQWHSRQRYNIKTWDKHYWELISFIEQNKKLPTNHKTNTKEERFLLYWCRRQRESFKKNKISKYRFEKLNELKVWKWASMEFLAIHEQNFKK
jgi:hypothetical protein